MGFLGTKHPEKMVVITSRVRPEERAHVSAMLVQALVMINLRLLLIDLDPQGLATRQVFGSLGHQKLPPQGVPFRPLVSSDLKRLRFDLVRGRRWFIRSAYLYAVPGRQDYKRLEESDGDEIEGAFHNWIAAIPRAKFPLLLVDTSQLPARMSHIACKKADFILLPVDAGAGWEAEIRTSARVLRDIGIPPEKLFSLLTNTSRMTRDPGWNLSVERARKALELSRSGRLMQTQIAHDIGVLGAHGTEYETRDDWFVLADELVQLLKDPEEQAPA